MRGGKVGLSIVELCLVVLWEAAFFLWLAVKGWLDLRMGLAGLIVALLGTDFLVSKRQRLVRRAAMRRSKQGGKRT